MPTIKFTNIDILFFMAPFQDLSAMEAQMAELEEEQRKLKQIQSDIEV